jgi:hypothetical protein
MLGGSRRNVPTGATFWIVVLALIFVGVSAFAIPPAPFDVDKSVECGFLVGHSRFSVRLAEQLVSGGYTYLAIDLTQARLDRGEDTFWRPYVREVKDRRLPIWGWVGVSAGPEHARGVVEYLRSVNLAGLFVSGRDAVKVARDLRGRVREDFRVVPVVPFDAAPSQDGLFAVAMTEKEFVAHGDEFDLPVLIAHQMDAGAVRATREAAAGNYLVAGIAIPD